MASRLEMVLKELNENGNFRASLFSTSAGLVIASAKAEDIFNFSDKVWVRLSPATETVALNLTDPLSKIVKIVFLAPENIQSTLDKTIGVMT